MGERDINAGVGLKLLGEATFPELPRSWNEILSTRTRDRMRIRRRDKMLWAAYLVTREGRRLPRGVTGVELHFCCWGPRRRDPDNLFVKPLIDAMRAVGILPDDDQRHVRGVRLEYRQEKGAGRTRVRIFRRRP